MSRVSGVKYAKEKLGNILITDGITNSYKIRLSM